MLLVWHSAWRRHVYDETITDVLEGDEETFLYFIMPPIYEVESITIE